MKFGKGLVTGVALHLAFAAAAQEPQVFENEDRYFKEGLALYQRQLYGPAQLALSQYMALNRNDLRTVDAQYYYAVAGLHLFHPNAEMLVREFVLQHPDHPKAALANFELGSFYYNKKEYDRAVEYLKEVPGDQLDYETMKEAEFKLAYSHFALKQFPEAQNIFNRNKTGNHKFTYASSYYSGFLNFRSGNYEVAKADLRTAEKNDAYKQVVPAMLTEILYKEGNLDEVISYGEQTLVRKPRPQNADAVELMVGEAYYLKGNFAKAAEYFTAAIGTVSRNTDKDLLYKLAYSEYKTGKNSQAITHFKPLAAQKDTLGQNAAYHLGLAYLKAGNKPFARTAFDAARRTRFDQDIAEQSRFKYAQLNYETGNSREVINSLATFRKDFPKSNLREEADDLLSEAYLNSNNYLEAIKHIEALDVKGDRIRRTYQRVTFYQGVNYFNDAKFPEAVEMFDKSLKNPIVDSLVSASHFWKGEAYSAGQRWNEAANSYAAVFRTPGSQRTEYYDKARYGIGYAYYNNKEYERALTHFRSYVKDADNRKNPLYYTDAKLRLADTYYVTKNYREAIDLYGEVIEAKSPDSDYALFQKGVVLGITGKRDNAKETLEQLVQRYPNSRYYDEARYQRAQIDFENGNYAPAIAGFSTLIDDKNSGRLTAIALQKRGLAYLNLRKYDEAISDFKRIIDQFSSNRVAAGAIVNLQEALTAANRNTEFDLYLAKFKAANPQSDAIESIEFEAAKNLYFNEKYDLAANKLEGYLKAYPNTKFAMDARYFLGDSYYRLGKKQQAVQQMKEVVTENQSEYVNRALSRIAEIESDQKNYREALKYYTLLSNRANSKKEQTNALLGLLLANYNLQDYAATKQTAGMLLSQSNAAVNATNLALLYKAKATYAQGNLPEAITELNAVTATASDESGAEAQYLLAEAYLKQGKHSEALDAAYKSGDNFASYDYWLGRSFLVIADVFIATNENFQARATLNSLIENSPYKEIVDMAKQRLTSLDAAGNTKAPESGAETEKGKKQQNRNVTQPDSIR